MKQGKQVVLFLKKKNQKDFYESKVFCAAFVQKSCCLLAFA
jgi:hypothetical protein